MPIALDELASRLVPGKTTLLLGAGASVPSGAPSGAELARHLWKVVGKSDPQSDDLIETASLLVRNFGRRAVMDEVVAKLKPLKPKGGLLGLVQFGWLSIYTTNFDQLVEDSLKVNKIPACVFKSNYDFTNKENQEGVKLFKLHGCVTQDAAFGHKSSMTITEEDYETFDQFRQTMFANLSAAMLMGDILVIGQSLRDRHLNDLVKKVLAAKPQGAPGTLYVLVYDRDDIRAPLLEDKGARVIFGGLDELVHALANGPAASVVGAAVKVPDILPVSIVSATWDVSTEASGTANILRMFNGGPATYSDIKAGATFERQLYQTLKSQLAADLRTLVVTGAAGVGKTTFARQMVLGLQESGVLAWEHRADFAFQYRPWLAVESDLRRAGLVGVLLVDECTHYLRAVNQLVDELAALDAPALRVVLTANSAQWVPRLKSPNIFSKGRVLELSQLKTDEINGLVNLLERNQTIRNLVDKDFRKKPRERQVETLKQRCSADMFVCFSNIFATESLDVIILREYEQLDSGLQDYYRYVAALQAVGAKVHRQLIIRMLKLPPDHVAAALDGLHGIIDEYDIRPKDGIYGWTTRHIVIARKITDYKFSGIKELTKLFKDIIENLNPSVAVELQSVRDLCDAEFGIGRLGDAKTRKELYESLIAVAPAERIPWHRLVRELLDEGDFEGTEYAIRDAMEAVGKDAPIDRYRVRLLMMRAIKTSGIMEVDRLAMLRKAYELAIKNTDAHNWDKYSFVTLCDVAVQLVQRGETDHLLGEAIAKLRDAAERIQDPDMQRQVRQFEEIRARGR